MYYICIVACTDESHPEYDQIDQAYVGCWMVRDTEEQAIADAKEMITEEPWIIERVESAKIVTEDDFKDDPDGLGFYQQALLDKNIFAFNVFPRFPTYFVQFAATQTELDEQRQPTGNENSVDATLWVSMGCIADFEENPDDIDFMAADFWSTERANKAIEVAQTVAENEGLTVTDTVKHWPFSFRQIEDQPELEEYLNSAEEDGVCLVIWDHSKQI